MTGKEDKKEEWTVRLDSQDGGYGIGSTQKAEQQTTEKQAEEHLIDRELNEKKAT